MIDADLVLIHGILSSPRTWDKLIQRFKADDELQGLGIHSFGYPSPALPRGPLARTRTPGYDDIAQSLPAFLESHTTQGNTAIVTHSQGGLILQRYLAWMLSEGRGRELADIKLIVMLACPNEGSEYLRSIRKRARFNRHPQGKNLDVLNTDIAATRRLVTDRIDRATRVSDYKCPIPIYVYSGMSDGIVDRTSAQSYFRNAKVLPGDHSSILDPEAAGSLTFPILKRHLRKELYQTGGQPKSTGSRTDQNKGDRESGDIDSLEGFTPFFTGRIDQITEIEVAINAAQRPQNVHAIFVIHGVAGIGKTTLAVYMAHRLVSRFRGRAHQADLRMLARHVNLRGLGGPTRTDPADVIRRWLPDDIGPQKPATDLDGLTEQWRNYLSGKFLVLVLDNVNSEEQVLPFLPGGSGYIVLVTSRSPLQGLRSSRGATIINLSKLPKKEAVHLIKTASGRAIKEGDKKSVEGIANFFDYHPQAITIGLAGLREQPDISFGDRLAQLKDAPNSLLAMNEYLDAKSGGVAKSFEFSYLQLAEECQFVLRRLGLAPVPYISVEVAGILTDLPTAAVDTHLRRLQREGLVGQGKHGYHLHDLIHQYAQGLAGEDDPAENRRAVSRVLTYYYVSATYIDSLLTRQPPPHVLEVPLPAARHDFTDRDSAIPWARAELSNFLACADYATGSAISEEGGRLEQAAWTIRFSWALAGLLRNEGRWPRSIELQAQAVVAASQLHEPLAEANALQERAQLYRLSGDLAKAETDLVRAREIYHKIGGDAGETGEAHALNTYAVVLDQLKRPGEARSMLDASLASYRRLGNRLGEANVLHDQGMAQYFADHVPEAVDLIGQALALYQIVDHPLGKAHAHSNLAKAQRRVGLSRPAADNLEAAQGLYRQLSNRLGEATTLAGWGAALREQGSYERAESVLRQAVELNEKIGSKLALANTLEELAELRSATEDFASAKDLLRRALALYHKHDMQRDLATLLKKSRSLEFLDKEVDGHI